MSNQRFYASPTDTMTFPNGAIGHRSGGPFDCVGPYTKVRNCPVAGFPDVRLTCYATNYADTYFSVPACTQYQGRYISGFFATEGDEGIVFHPHAQYKEHFSVHAYAKAMKAIHRKHGDPQDRA